MKNQATKLLTLAALGITSAGTAAFADGHGSKSEIDELRARVEALEAGGGDLSFGGTSVDIYGYLKADFFYENDFAQGDTAFVNNIGEPANAISGDFGATARQTRLGFRTSTPSALGDVKGKLELDLFGSGGTAELRLRHASIDIGGTWLIGQDWTNFMPISHYPTSVEFNGPVGITFARVPQIRYTTSFDNVSLSASIEENNAASEDPVFTAAAAYNGEGWGARIAGLTGTVQSGGSNIDQTGITVSGTVSPWAGGTFTATYVYGEALGPLMIGGGAAAVGGQANDVEGYTVEFRQSVNDKLSVGIAYGREEYDLPTSTGTLSFDELETVHLNAFYSLTDDLTIGAEYFYGERNDTITGRSFDDDRIQISAQLNF
ncbi:DcaP family trimeric outer membrane transporter [Thalassobius sp. Cn5-15]|uniref:DcaP family trimeric outer membrane transporter n=1 Tax=Thalassobius sp. Cn5-15 TaxID=2917763 RepID=UPI001EF3168D|nr:DcaP family trimeric outer membrane transporter [Thalassobius sp. Cn5-15]MCG7493112.1 porin [Thalassobius sp. Cn5-15]